MFHALYILRAIVGFTQIANFVYRWRKRSCKRQKFGMAKARILVHVLQMLARSVCLPILVGMVLYGMHLIEDREKTVRYFLAFSIIITSDYFMRFLSSFPTIGNYIFMLSKVSRFNIGPMNFLNCYSCDNIPDCSRPSRV